MLLYLSLVEFLLEVDIGELRVLFVSLVNVVADAIGEGTIVGDACDKRRWRIGNSFSQSPGMLNQAIEDSFVNHLVDVFIYVLEVR